MSTNDDPAALAADIGARLTYAHWRLTQTPLARTATGKVIRRSLAL